MSERPALGGGRRAFFVPFALGLGSMLSSEPEKRGPIENPPGTASGGLYPMWSSRRRKVAQCLALPLGAPLSSPLGVPTGEFCGGLFGLTVTGLAWAPPAACASGRATIE